MSLTVNWDNEAKTVILITMISPLANWQEFDNAVDEAVALAASVTHPLGVISHAGSIPMPRGVPLPHILRAFRIMPPNIKYVVGVMDDNFATSIMTAVSRLSVAKSYQITTSLEHAREMMQQRFAVQEV